MVSLVGILMKSRSSRGAPVSPRARMFRLLFVVSGAVDMSRAFGSHSTLYTRDPLRMCAHVGPHACVHGRQSFCRAGRVAWQSKATACTRSRCVLAPSWVKTAIRVNTTMRVKTAMRLHTATRAPHSRRQTTPTRFARNAHIFDTPDVTKMPLL